jgi:hypothetical protein
MAIATNPKTGETVYLADDGAWKPAQTAVNPQTKQMLAHDGKDWVPVPAKSKGVLDYIDDAVRSIASGVTFGYADELAAKMDEVTGRGGTYGENLKKEHARDAQIPGAIKIPGEVAGAVAGAVAAAPVTGAIAAVTGASRLPALVRAGISGAGGGALFGSGDAEEGKRLEGAAKGGAVGAVAGPVISGAVRAGGSVVQSLRGAVTPQANVTADLARAIERDGTTPAALTQRMEELNQIRPGFATLADAGGENVRGLVERVAQTPGAGRTTVVPALTARQQGQIARLSGDLRQLTGTHQSATRAITETMEQRAEAARPAYDAAMNFNAREVPEIVRAWTDATSTGWGQNILRSPDFRRTLQTEYGIADPTNAPLMTVIDAWKKRVDDQVTEAIRGGNNNKARVLSNMRDRVVDTVDTHNPAYGEARAAWAGPTRYMNAIEEGRNILNTRVSAEELARGVENMAAADQEAFRIGAVSSLIGKMGSDTARMPDLTKYLRSPEMRAKIAAIMPTPEARQTWAQRLDFEVSSSELTGRALGNSATARRLAERQDADGIVGDLVMDAFSGHPPVSLLRRAVGAVPQRVRDTLRSRSDEILADLLTNPAGMAAVRQAVDRVVGHQPLRITVHPAATNAANAVIQGVGQ